MLVTDSQLWYVSNMFYLISFEFSKTKFKLQLSELLPGKTVGVVGNTSIIANTVPGGCRVTGGWDSTWACSGPQAPS